MSASLEGVDLLSVTLQRPEMHICLLPVIHGVPSVDMSLRSTEKNMSLGLQCSWQGVSRKDRNVFIVLPTHIQTSLRFSFCYHVAYKKQKQNQRSSIQCKVVSMRSGKPTCASSSLSGVSPVLARKNLRF